MKKKEIGSEASKGSDLNSKDEYIKSLELSINILQNELKEFQTKEQENEKKIINQADEENLYLNLSNCLKISDVFDALYYLLTPHFSIVELDLFLFNNNRQSITNINWLNLSSTLKKIYNDLEEDGLIDWVFDEKKIKIIDYQQEDNPSIRSLIIIPILLQNMQTAVFLANSIISADELNNKNILNLHGVMEKACYLISLMQLQMDKNTLQIEHSILRNQTLRASNQLAISEIIVNINDIMALPLKIIKSNLELLDKGVGDIQRRLEIISEQFTNLNAARLLLEKYSLNINEIVHLHPVIDLLEAALEILNSHISKNGVTLYKTIEIDDKINVLGYKTQLIFSILNIILYSSQSMADGGNINIGIYKSDENNTVALIINDDGTGLSSPEINGDLIMLADLSENKIKSRYLFLLSQHIIAQHSGFFSVYFEAGKGTTYKIILPIAPTT